MTELESLRSQLEDIRRNGIDAQVFSINISSFNYVS